MRVLSVVALLLVVAPVIDGGAADAQESLARARLLYNERQFEEAVNAADEARAGFPDSVDLIAARAYLERFRESAANDNLASARDRLRRINPGGFGIPERIEFIIGLGQALYFDNSPGAAVSLFASVLDGVHVLGPDARERVLDWWASALDGEARPRADAERVSLYREIQERMERELADRPGSAVAAYWFGRCGQWRGAFRHCVGQGQSRVDTGAAHERLRCHAAGRFGSARAACHRAGSAPRRRPRLPSRC